MIDELDRIYLLISRRPGISPSQISEALKIDEGVTRDCIKTLEGGGLIISKLDLENPSGEKRLFPVPAMKLLPKSLVRELSKKI